MKSETSFRVFFLKQHRKKASKIFLSHQKVYFWISAFDHRAIVLDKMHIVQWWVTIALGLSALTVSWPAKMFASTSTHIISRFTVLRHDCLIRILPEEKEAESYQQLRCNCSKWWGGVRKKQSAWWGQNWGWASSTKMEEGASLRFDNPTA